MRYFYLLFTILLIGPAILIAQKQEVPDKALCVVCVLKGETEPEKVKAHTEHDGKAYYFCSKNCKKEFAEEPVAYLPPQLPRPAPNFVVETLDGGSVSLKDFENKIVLLDFWATWCKPCLEYMPSLQQLYTSYSDQGFVVLGISIDEGKDRVKKIRKFIDKAGISYPIFLDGKHTPAWHIFKVKAIPALFLIDGNGKIVAQWTGKMDHNQIKTEVINRVERKKGIKNQ